MEDLAELSDGLNGSGEVVRGGVYVLCDKDNSTYRGGGKD